MADTPQLGSCASPRCRQSRVLYSRYCEGHSPDRRRQYDDHELALIAQGRHGEAKGRWEDRWIAAGRPSAMLRQAT